MKKKEHAVLVFLKYAAVGALAAAAELSLLHALTTRTSIWYVYASAISSVLSFVVGFTLRKIWVFREKGWKHMTREMSLYFLSLLLVVGTNTLLMSFLVEHFGLPFVLAQFLSGLITGLIGFIINRKFTFHYR